MTCNAQNRGEALWSLRLALPKSLPGHSSLPPPSHGPPGRHDHLFAKSFGSNHTGLEIQEEEETSPSKRRVLNLGNVPPAHRIPP